MKFYIRTYIILISFFSTGTLLGFPAEKKDIPAAKLTSEEQDRLYENFMKSLEEESNSLPDEHTSSVFSQYKYLLSLYSHFKIFAPTNPIVKILEKVAKIHSSLFTMDVSTLKSNANNSALQHLKLFTEGLIEAHQLNSYLPTRQPGLASDGPSAPWYKRLPKSLLLSLLGFSKFIGIQTTTYGIKHLAWLDLLNGSLSQINLQLNPLFQNNRLQRFITSFLASEYAKNHLTTQEFTKLEESLQNNYWNKNMLPDENIGLLDDLVFLREFGETACFKLQHLLGESSGPESTKILAEQNAVKNLNFWYDNFFIKKICAAGLFDFWTKTRNPHTNPQQEEYITLKVSTLQSINEITSNLWFLGLDSLFGWKNIDEWTLGLANYKTQEQLLRAVQTYALCSENGLINNNKTILSQHIYALNEDSLILKSIYTENKKLRKPKDIAKVLIANLLVRGICKKIIMLALSNSNKIIVPLRKTYEASLVGLEKVNLISKQNRLYYKYLVPAIAKQIAHFSSIGRYDEVRSIFVAAGISTEIMEAILSKDAQNVFYKFGDDRLLHKEIDLQTPNEIIANYYSTDIALLITNQVSDICANGKCPENYPFQQIPIEETNTGQNQGFWNIFSKNHASKLKILNYIFKGTCKLSKITAIASAYYPYALLQHYIKISNEIIQLEPLTSVCSKKRLLILKGKLQLTKNESLAWQNSRFACI